MVVGYRKHWKLPIGYFLVKGVKGGVLSGIVRACLERASEVGIKIWTLTMDGTGHNIAAFSYLGANVLPVNPQALNSGFEHPKEPHQISAVLDPPHMIKLIRSTLADFKEFVWEGKGNVKWEYITRLHSIQQEHGLRLGNKLTEAHVTSITRETK